MGFPVSEIGNQHMGWYQFSGFELSGGTVAPTMVVRSNFRVPEYTINDDSVIHFRVPRTWHPSSPRGIVVTISWGCNEAYALGNGKVLWRIVWEAVPADSTVALTAATTTVNSAELSIPATADTITETTLTTIAAASVAANDVIGMTISRRALTVGADPVAEPYIMAVEIGFPAIFPSYEQ